MADNAEQMAKKPCLPSEGHFVHHAAAVWDDRESYGPAGIGGLFSNYYAALCAAFAALGGLIFGYDQVRDPNLAVSRRQ